MARGTVVGETPVSQANTEAFEEGYARIFGDKPPQRGRWYSDPKTGELSETPPDWEPTDGQRVDVVSDRYMEGDRAPDGTPIDSRQKRRAWMRTTGAADHGDYSPAYFDKRRSDSERGNERRLDEAFDRARHEVFEAKRKPRTERNFLK